MTYDPLEFPSYDDADGYFSDPSLLPGSAPGGLNCAPIEPPFNYSPLIIPPTYRYITGSSVIKEGDFWRRVELDGS